VVAGLGKNFLARKAAQLAGINEVIDLDTIVKGGVATVSPAAGVALMAATKMEGRTLQWTQ
jgi:uncharacterized hydantoinase/oxoprolinase family protein